MTNVGGAGVGETFLNSLAIDDGSGMDQRQRRGSIRPFRRSSLQGTDFRTRYFHTLALVPPQSVSTLQHLDERLTEPSSSSNVGGASSTAAPSATVEPTETVSPPLLHSRILEHESQTLHHYVITATAANFESGEEDSEGGGGLANKMFSTRSQSSPSSGGGRTRRRSSVKEPTSVREKEFDDDVVSSQNTASQEPLSYTQVACKILQTPETVPHSQRLGGTGGGTFTSQNSYRRTVPTWMKGASPHRIQPSQPSGIASHTSTTDGASIELHPTLRSKSIQQFTNLSTTLNQLGSQHLDQDLHLISQLLEAFDAGIAQEPTELETVRDAGSEMLTLPSNVEEIILENEEKKLQQSASVDEPTKSQKETLEGYVHRYEQDDVDTSSHRRPYYTTQPTHSSR
uniref:Uncharacterized protein n=1 Tax=Lygus hesperus TaxID=30085 RepID=A0A146KSH7_LYGHE